jgi:hypothetical protein
MHLPTASFCCTSSSWVVSKPSPLSVFSKPQASRQPHDWGISGLSQGPKRQDYLKTCNGSIFGSSFQLIIQASLSNSM